MAANAKGRTKVPNPPQDGQSDPMAALGKARGIGAVQPKVVGAAQMEVPGVQTLANYLANKVDNPNGQGGYLRGLVAGGIQGAGNLVATGFDPRNVNVAHAAAPIGGGEGGPIARFLGWQRGVPEKGIPHTPMYNIEAPGHPLDRSTVTPATLEHHGIAYTPPPPPHWEDVAVTGQGEQVPSSYFNKGSSVPNPDVTMRDHTLRGGDNDRMARLVQKMGGLADTSKPKPRK